MKILLFPFRAIDRFLDWLCNAFPMAFMLLVVVVVSIPFGLLASWIGEGRRSTEPHKLLEYVEGLEARVAALESASRSAR